MNELDQDPAPPPVSETLQLAALAIALADRPSPRERAALFDERSPEDAVALFRRRFGEPVPEVRLRAEGWRGAAQRAGRRLLILGTDEYPERLAEIPVPPIAVDVAGAGDLDAPAVAIVGARRATPYGISVSEQLGAGLAEAGFTVVSGLARGVDAAAHRAALDAGGSTVAILGSAHDRLYPPEHHGLARQCAASGAVASEFSPGTRPLPHHFPRRNRIIAGLALGTVVVEAAERSGSLATARHAVECGREVFAVPGPVHSETSAGCHALIRQGAVLAASVRDILEELGPLARREDMRPDREAGGPGTSAPQPSTKPAAAAGRVLEALRAVPTGVDIDTLVAGCGLAIPEALAAVSDLERRGLVRRFPGDFLRASGTGRDWRSLH